MQALHETSSPQNSGETIETANCPTHGDFAQRCQRLDGFGREMVIRSRCPTCSTEERAEKERAEQRQKEVALANGRARLREFAGIPRRYESADFDGYISENAGQRMVSTACRRFADTLPAQAAKGGSLVLTGGPGTGKTHLACAIGNVAIHDHLLQPLFATTLGMLREIKQTYSRDSDRSESDVLAMFGDVPLLILDEVGVQIGSEHEKMLLFDVLNERYQNMRSTVLISNLTADELEAFLGHRVMDRYRECGVVLAFDWESHRGLK